MRFTRDFVRTVTPPGAAAMLLTCGGCVTASLSPTQQQDGVYTLWAQDGLAAANWDRAERDAIARAQEFCGAKGLVYAQVREAKTGTPGATALRTTVSFRCEKGFSPPATPVSADCGEQMSDPGLTPIRSKVQLSPESPDTAPPFQVAADDSYPDEVERQAIAKWASLRDACLSRRRAGSPLPASATPLQATFMEQDRSFAEEVSGKVSALIVALYQGKLTYGEFAQKRYEFDRDGAAAEREFQQATRVEDPQHAAQAQQLALQNFQMRLAIWNTYIQAVNSRTSRGDLRGK